MPLIRAADGRRFVVPTGSQKLADRLKAGLSTPLGTWRWDTTLGVPFLGAEKLTVSILKAFVRRYLNSFPEVDRALRVDITQSGSTASLEFSVLTNTGETVPSSVPL